MFTVTPRCLRCGESGQVVGRQETVCEFLDNRDSFSTRRFGLSVMSVERSEQRQVVEVHGDAPLVPGAAEHLQYFASQPDSLVVIALCECVIVGERFET